MSLKPPPFRFQIVKDGFVQTVWKNWFQELRNFVGNDPVPLRSYTVSTVPDATQYEGHIIYVSDETGGATLAFSDGSDWRRAQDRNIIS